ncbi:unnamed protein product [Rotaria sordida]|uniref:B box-type domain-containing protein n=1 Tax=Rotaria sordida TaxID=392033 RepID=A0A814GQN2_9BILA|nr:unnamed protein product [Rotaria sordida]
MATGTSRTRCSRCDKERRGAKCDGCSQLYCYDCLPHHRQELSKELDEIETTRNLFRQTLTEQTQDPKKHSLIKQINQWEEDSIKKIKQTAHECRQLLLQHTIEHITQIEVNLAKLTDKLKKTRQENDFNEIDLNEFKSKLAQLAKELDKPPNASIKQENIAIINRISVVVSPTNKTPFLQSINPAIFFDDSRENIDRAKTYVPSAQVIYGINNLDPDILIKSTSIESRNIQNDHST